jgi:hypothetical protein
MAVFEKSWKAVAIVYCIFLLIVGKRWNEASFLQELLTLNHRLTHIAISTEPNPV